MYANFIPYDPVAIELGPFQIRWYAVFILSGALLALILAIKEGKKLGVSKDFLEDLVLYGLPISILGARIYYVVFEWDQYKENLLKVLMINEGGLAIHGAIIAALAWGYFYCKKKEVNFLKVLDLGAVGFLIAQAIGRWGNFMNQEAHGGLVPGNSISEQRMFLSDKLNLPDFITNQMFINGEQGLGYYHPTFLYESVWNLIGFSLLIILRKTKLLYIGDLFSIYLIWYSIGRFYIEGLRTDSLYIGDSGYRTAQVISIIMIFIGLTLLIGRHLIIYLNKKNKIKINFKKLFPVKYYELVNTEVGQ